MGPPILLIHGLAGDADVWGACLDELAQDHRVVAYDRRGYTRSGHVPRGDFRRDGEDAAAVLRACDAAPATVVGWSSAGIVALRAHRGLLSHARIEQIAGAGHVIHLERPEEFVRAAREAAGRDHHVA